MVSPLQWQEPPAYTKTQTGRDGAGVLSRLLSSVATVSLGQEGVLCKRGLRSGLRKWHEILFCQFLTEIQSGIAYNVLALYNDLGRETARYALSSEVSQERIATLLRQAGREIREERAQEPELKEEKRTPSEPPVPQPQAPSIPEDTTLASAEFSALVQREMEAWAAGRGFQKKAAGTLAWIRQEGEEYLQFWVRISPMGTNRFAGSSFQIVFQRSASPQTSAQLVEGVRRRLTDSLSVEELEQVRALQNEVIARLPAPPPDFGQPKIHESLLAYLQEQFQPIETEYAEESDIWFRYRTQEDVCRWMEAARGWAARVEEGGST